MTPIAASDLLELCSGGSVAGAGLNLRPLGYERCVGPFAAVYSALATIARLR